MLVMLIRVAPLLGAGVLAAFLGYHLTDRVLAISEIYQWLILLGLFIGLIILDKEPGWNVVLYLGFALVAGALFCRSGALTGQVKSWVLFSALFLISLTGGAFSSKGTERVAVILFPVILFYMSGWVFFLLFPVPVIFTNLKTQ